MNRSYEQFSVEDKGKAKRAFNEHFDELLGQLRGRPEDYERAIEIQAHSEDARNILNENFKEERQDRVSKVAVEVWDERLRKYFHYPEHIRIRLMTEQSILDEARQRVDHAHDKDLRDINENERKAIEGIVNETNSSQPSDQNKEIEIMSEQEKAAHLVADIHRLARENREARFQVSKIVGSTREQMLEEAKSNGAEDPHAQVKAVIASMYKGVDDKHHREITATFEKWGYDADHQHVRFVAENEGLESSEILNSETQQHLNSEKSLSQTSSEQTSTQIQIDDQEQ